MACFKLNGPAFRTSEQTSCFNPTQCLSSFSLPLIFWISMSYFEFYLRRIKHSTIGPLLIVLFLNLIALSQKINHFLFACPKAFHCLETFLYCTCIYYQLSALSFSKNDLKCNAWSLFRWQFCIFKYDKFWVRFNMLQSDLSSQSLNATFEGSDLLDFDDTMY